MIIIEFFSTKKKLSSMLICTLYMTRDPSTLYEEKLHHPLHGPVWVVYLLC